MFLLLFFMLLFNKALELNFFQNVYFWFSFMFSVFIYETKIQIFKHLKCLFIVAVESTPMF